MLRENGLGRATGKRKGGVPIGASILCGIATSICEKIAGKGPKLTFPAETMWVWAVGKARCSHRLTSARRTPPPAECVIPKAARHYLNQNFYLPNGLFIGNTSLEKVKVILHDSDSPKPHILSIRTFLFFKASYSSATISIYGVFFSLLMQFQPSMYAENLISKEQEESSV